MKKRLSVQVGVIISLFLAAVLITVEAVLFTSTLNVYLSAKDDVLGRDLTAMYEDMHVADSIAGSMGYWHDNIEKMKAGLSDDDLDYLYVTVVRDNDFEWYSAEKGDEYITEMEKTDPVYLHSVEEAAYSVTASFLQERFTSGAYDELYLLDISNTADGTVLISKNKDSDNIFNAAAGDLGGRPRIDILHTKAADTIRRGKQGDIPFDIIHGDDGTPYYAGYILVSVKDDHRYTLCTLFNWSEFRQTPIRKCSAKKE